MSAPWAWRARFRARTYLKDSLWVLPLAYAVLGLLLALASSWLDARIEAPRGLQYEPGTAATVLTTIAGAMVGLLGLVVTIGVLVVQQATSALSPRFMRMWYRQRLQKIVLGTFAGTFTFAFANLRRVADGAVPDVGVTIAGILCLASLVLLLVYLDNFIHHLRPVAVAARVSAAGQRALVAAARSDWLALPAGYEPPESGRSLVIRAREAGVIQGVHTRALLAHARSLGCTVTLPHGVGSFVPAGSPVLEVWGPRVPAGADLERCLVQGVERSVEHDPAFALRILVDIAIRALSPAVNDPTTAVQVLDYIESFLQFAAHEPLRPAAALLTPDGVPAVIVPSRPWEAYVELAVTEIRRFGRADVQVCRRLAAVLDQLSQSVPGERRAAIEHQRTELAAVVSASFPESAAHHLAATSDRQGLGGTSLGDGLA